MGRNDLNVIGIFSQLKKNSWSLPVVLLYKYRRSNNKKIQMTDFLTPNILFYLCIFLLMLLIAMSVYARNIDKRLTQSIKLINDLYKLSQDQAIAISQMMDKDQNTEQTESATDAEALAKKHVADLAVKIDQRILTLENQTQLLQQESPELKMYKRASQLAQEGASIDDVMEASQLPRAEVEVLMGLYSKKKKPT